MSQQGNWCYCKKCEGLFFVGNNPGVCPAGDAHDDSLSGGYLLSQSSPGQSGWSFCQQCQGLFYTGNNLGVCPVHTTAGATYVVPTSPAAGLQPGWSWCNKCQDLFFPGNGLGFCAAGGSHDPNGSGSYYLSQSVGISQSGWRYCGKCQALFFEEAPSRSSTPGIVSNNLGVCPAGGAHENSGGDYVLSQSGAGQPGWGLCGQCLSLFFTGNNLGVCPAPQPHTTKSSGPYFLTQNTGQSFTRGVQTGWKWCSQCQGLYFASSPGVCPARIGSSNQPSVHTTPEGDADYALIQMGGSFNYILSNNGNPLFSVQVIVTITEDLVYAYGTGPAGVSFQLNAYSNNNQSAVGWQQYSFAFDGESLTGEVDNWPATGSSNFLNNVGQGPLLANLPSNKIPKGYVLGITLTNDISTQSVTGAEFSVPAASGLGTTSKLLTLTQLKQTDGSPVTAENLAQIVAFRLNIVGLDNSANAVFSSGKGTISYSASGVLTASNVFPSNALAQNTVTNESSNVIYSEMPGGSSHVLRQNFSVTVGVPQYDPPSLSLIVESNETGYDVSWSGTDFPKGQAVDVYLAGLTGLAGPTGIGSSIADFSGDISGAYTYVCRPETPASPNVTLQAQVGDVVVATSNSVAFNCP
jgi:hypothetical protein